MNSEKSKFEILFKHPFNINYWNASLNVESKNNYFEFFNILFKFLLDKYNLIDIENKQNDSIEKQEYNDYITTFIHVCTQRKDLFKELIKYISLYSGVPMNIKRVEVSDLKKIIIEFVYLGTSPSLIKNNYNEHSILLDDFEYKYFIWIKKNESYKLIADEDEIINKENFNKYKYSHINTLGWSKKQLYTFFKINILPVLCSSIELNKQDINVYNLVSKKTLISAIQHFFKEYTFHANELILAIKNLNYDKNPFKFIQFVKKYGVKEDDKSYILYELMYKIKLIYLNVIHSINRKLQRIKEKVSEQELDTSKYKYKWQRMCAKLSSLDLNELRDLAAIEGIEFYEIKTKRELCKSFHDKLRNSLNSD